MNAIDQHVLHEEIPLQSQDGHACTLIARIPAQPSSALLWVPALGVAARHYLPFADALAAKGVAVFVHEWRGNGSSSLRANRRASRGRVVHPYNRRPRHASCQRRRSIRTARKRRRKPDL